MYSLCPQKFSSVGTATIQMNQEALVRGEAPLIRTVHIKSRRLDEWYLASWNDADNCFPNPDRSLIADEDRMLPLDKISDLWDDDADPSPLSKKRKASRPQQGANTAKVAKLTCLQFLKPYFDKDFKLPDCSALSMLKPDFVPLSEVRPEERPSFGVITNDTLTTESGMAVPHGIGSLYQLVRVKPVFATEISLGARDYSDKRDHGCPLHNSYCPRHFTIKYKTTPLYAIELRVSFFKTHARVLLNAVPAFAQALQLLRKFYEIPYIPLSVAQIITAYVTGSPCNITLSDFA